MDILSSTEIRILGALIEKEITTPDYYPLSLNSLTNACNQKSNRNPVMKLEENTIVRQLDELKSKQLVREVHPAIGRVNKYKHTFSSVNEFTKQETGLLCVLFLRGPQTLGELRTHTARLCEFESLEEVETVVEHLMKTEDGPYIQKLPRETGRRENRYAHLFSGEIEIDTLQQQSHEPAVIEVQAENKRIEALEQEVTSLKEELNNLQEQFSSFKRQFE